MQGFMENRAKKHAHTREYTSPKQLRIAGFETPFEQNLPLDNRWVVLGNLIPWDSICGVYVKAMGKSSTGRKPLNPRIALGAIIIKHLCNLDDRETIAQITENICMQYFLGYASYDPDPPFDPSLFVELRKRLGDKQLNEINERIVAIQLNISKAASTDCESKDNDHNSQSPTNKGRVIFDATACPQDIAYPTDLDLLNEAREKSEQIIDEIYNKRIHGDKPRTYREIARKRYLFTAQKKNKSQKQIRKALRSQLGFLGRNIRTIHKLLDMIPDGIIPLEPREYKYLLVIQVLYAQQDKMYRTNTHTIEDRIVSIHQPHVRPIVRGKSQAKVEFGAKIHVSLIDGIAFLDEISWDPFNEGSHMKHYVENFRTRFGHYPAEVLADKIYCTRANRMWLKELGIKLIAKPLGRPSAVQIHVSPGERNPIEGKFGQAKTAYGLNRIKARRKITSESWIAGIFLVLNLVNLAGRALLCKIINLSYSFSASTIVESEMQNYPRYFSTIKIKNQMLNSYRVNYNLVA